MLAGWLAGTRAQHCNVQKGKYRGWRGKGFTLRRGARVVERERRRAGLAYLAGSIAAIECLLPRDLNERTWRLLIQCVKTQDHKSLPFSDYDILL